MRRISSCLCGLLIAGGCFSDPPSGTSGPGEDGSTGTEDTSTTGSPGTTTTTSDDGSTSTPDPSTTAATDPSTTSHEETSTGPGDSSSTGVPPDTGPMPQCPPDQPVLYINFEGATLEDSGTGIDNAPSGIVGNPQLAGEYGPYNGADLDMVFDLVQGHFQPVGVCVLDVVPEAPDYDMIVVTSDTFNDDPNILGMPNLDCENAQLNNVNVVFLSAMVNIGPPQRAIAISKFAGALYGLEDVSTNEDIMNQFVAMTSNGAMFTDVCFPLVAAPVCPSGGFCASGEQSSLNRLMNAF